MKASTRKASSGQAVIGLVFFLVGFAGAYGFGWWGANDGIYASKAQPVNFPHSMHTDEDCDSCHYVRDDGSYSGAPNVDKCAECHSDPMGDSEDEAKLIEEYIEPEKKINWYVYAHQPDNVYFSHPAHLGQDMECTTCHRAVEDEEKLPAYRENRITGYSANTMNMVQCETCHAEKGASNACGVCHK